MRWLILFLASTCFGQLPVVPLPQFKATSGFPGPFCGGNSAIGSGAPTNQSGYPAYTWYVACGFYGTNGGVSTWTNLTSNSGLNLTNAFGDGPLQGPTVNGLNSLTFHVNSDAANESLQNTAYSVPSASHFEVIMVVALTNTTGRAVWSDAAQSSFTGMTVGPGAVNGSEFQLYAGSAAINVCDTLSNQFAVYDFVMTGGASSTIYTNNVQGLSGNPGTLGLPHGFELSPHELGAIEVVAELITFQTNLVTTPRSNIFNYLTNKYNINL